MRTGEVIPVDGTVLSAEAVVDTSTLSGEPLPLTLTQGMQRAQRQRQRGRPVRGPGRAPGRGQRLLRARASRAAGAGPARAVRAHGRSLCRLLPARHAAARRRRVGGQRRRRARARRSGRRDPVPADPRRADRARLRHLPRRARGRVVKGAGAIETLGEARTVLFDKTGTLTVGTPEVREIMPVRGFGGRAAASCGIARPSRARARRGARARGRQAELALARQRGAGGSGQGIGHARARGSRSAAGRSCAGRRAGGEVALGTDGTAAALARRRCSSR